MLLSDLKINHQKLLSSQLRTFKINTPDTLSQEHSTLLAKKIANLKSLGLQYVDLKNVDTRLACELTDQMYRLIIKYGCLVSYLGVTQPFLQKVHEDRITNLATKYISEGITKEKAWIESNNFWRDFPLKEKTHIAYYHGKSDNHCIYDGSEYKQVTAITINKNISKSYSNLLETLKNDVRMQYHPPGCDKPAALISHEWGHAMCDMVNSIVLNDTLKKQYPELNFIINDVLYSFCLSYSLFGNEISGYVTESESFEEFIAEAFAESLHNPHPRYIAMLIKGEFDKLFELIQTYPANSKTLNVPKFVKSKYFMSIAGRFHLISGAPKKTVKEFEEFMNYREKRVLNKIKMLKAKQHVI